MDNNFFYINQLITMLPSEQQFIIMIWKHLCTGVPIADGSQRQKEYLTM